MALDRRILIQQRTQDFDLGGRPEETVTPIATVWAQQGSAGAADTPTSGGIVVTEVRNFTVRWTAELAALTVAETEIVDAAGNLWNVDSMSESDARQRFISFQCLRNNP